MACTRITLGYRPLENGPRYWMNVVVYETAAELQRAAHQHRPVDGPEFWENCAGCWQPHDNDRGYLGIMRLNMEHLTAEIVIHEAVHAAVTYARKSLGLQVIHLNPYSRHSMAEREEVLAHAVNDIAGALLRHLKILPAMGTPS